MTTVTPFNSRDPVNEAKGGTAQSSYATGDMLYASATDTLSKLTIGTSGKVLSVSSGIPSWQNVGLPDGTNALNTVYLVDDLFGSEALGGAYAFRRGNNGASSNSTYSTIIDHPGIVQFDTGTTSTGNAYLYFGNLNVSANSQLVVLGGGTTQLDVIAKIPTLSDGTNRFKVRLGFIAFSGTPPTTITDGCWFEYIDNVNSGKWTINTSQSSTPSSANTNSTVDTNWHRYTITVNAAGTSVAFYIDDVQVTNSPIATNIPTTNPLTWGCDIVKSLGGTTRTVQLDLVVLKIDLTSSR